MDLYVNTPKGAKRIIHKFGAVRRLLEAPVLTAMEDWPPELKANFISLKEAQKFIKGGAKAYLYFIREHGSDADKDDSGMMNSMGNGRNLMEDSSPVDLDSTDVSGNLIQDSAPNSTDGKMRSMEKDPGFAAGNVMSGLSL